MKLRNNAIVRITSKLIHRLIMGGASLSFILLFSYLLSATAGNANADEIAIGVAGPMTGELEQFGKQLRLGAELAVKDINDAGGILGRKLKLEVADDRCEPKGAVSAANELISKEVVFVVGHFCSIASIPASEVYAEKEVLQITPASTRPALTEEAAAKGITTLLRTVGRDDNIADFAGMWIADAYRGKNIAVIGDKTSYEMGIASQAKVAIEATGSKVSAVDSYASDADLSDLALKLKDAKTDVVFISGSASDVAKFARDAKEIQWDTVLVSGDDLLSYEFLKEAGISGEGAKFVVERPLLDLDSTKSVIARLRSESFEPDDYALRTYAAVQAFAAAATETGGLNGKKMAEWLKENTVSTVIGDLRWDVKGDIVQPDYSVYEWRDGKVVPAAVLSCPPYCRKKKKQP